MEKNIILLLLYPLSIFANYILFAGTPTMFFDIVALQRIQKRNVSSVYTGVMAGESNFNLTKK